MSNIHIDLIGLIHEYEADLIRLKAQLRPEEIYYNNGRISGQVEQLEKVIEDLHKLARRTKNEQ